jgi:hypothetical protein
LRPPRRGAVCVDHPPGRVSAWPGGTCAKAVPRPPTQRVQGGNHRPPDLARPTREGPSCRTAFTASRGRSGAMLGPCWGRGYLETYKADSYAHARESILSMQERFLHGQERFLQGQESFLQGQAWGLHGQESCVHGQESCRLQGQECVLHGQECVLHGQESCVHRQECGPHGRERVLQRPGWVLQRRERGVRGPGPRVRPRWWGCGRGWWGWWGCGRSGTRLAACRPGGSAAAPRACDNPLARTRCAPIANCPLLPPTPPPGCAARRSPRSPPPPRRPPSSTAAGPWPRPRRWACPSGSPCPPARLPPG